ncbi:putative Integral membrane sensor signal transduction histidine kinase [Candidatus Zixiibacteriota bacterium]|nr:putative Integral membrane sensor signal transduction histidine kinase [candidate division Zixibacteria bacterium]
MQKNDWIKVLTLAIIVAITVAIHYGWVLTHFFGHSAWIHAIHSRLCYIPIVAGAAWFGLRGGLAVALAISILIQPYIFILGAPHSDVSSELVEIVFYFALAFLTGGLIDRETKIRKRQEETQLQLERSHQLSMIGQMAAGVAHEIKNPLASIKGAVEILKGDEATHEEKKEFQDIIVREIKRIDGTVQEFLEFARPKEMEFARIDLGTTVQASIRLMQNQIESAGVSLETDVPENIMVMADPEKVHQVIINLLLNALEASKSGQKIVVRLGRDRRAATLAIRDQGDGMDPDDKAKIFDPFFTTKPHGTGLGLAIVKAIVERHKGTVEVDSTRGKGTIFTIRLPLAETGK